MLFNSFAFIVFFAIYFICHLLCPTRYRLFLIIAGSFVFYAAWNIYYAWVPLTLVSIAYAGALLIQKTSNRKVALSCVVILLLLPLFFFKYMNFFYNDVLGAIFPFKGKIVSLPLPLGISFMSFTLIAYLIETYKKEFNAEKNFSLIASYATFFPHVASGPILRPKDLIPQLRDLHDVKKSKFALGALIFSVGLLKKLVLADQISPAIDSVYSIAQPHNRLDYLLAIYGYPVQIYCDFSGYTDMAIGLALLLGFQLPINFDRPYAASSVADFWRRWHMTLSFWARDYIYIPLGGNRSGMYRQIRNVMVTMLVVGLWHGASWNFIIWGFIHGTGISINHLYKKLTSKWNNLKLPRWLCIFMTFNFVTIGWVLFRSPDLATISKILTGPFRSNAGSLQVFIENNFFILLLLGIFMLTHNLDSHQYLNRLAERSKRTILWPIIISILILSITLSTGSSAKFIYFDF
jgi:alginate O-acetyltransferase complex protein AlgI